MYFNDILDTIINSLKELEAESDNFWSSLSSHLKLFDGLMESKFPNTVDSMPLKILSNFYWAFASSSKLLLMPAFMKGSKALMNCYFSWFIPLSTPFMVFSRVFFTEWTLLTAVSKSELMVDAAARAFSLRETMVGNISVEEMVKGVPLKWERCSCLCEEYP